jgi:RNA polymerase-binding transcription factor DksA
MGTPLKSMAFKAGSKSPDKNMDDLKEKNFYSKAELEEFKVLINEKLVLARQEYKELVESLQDSNLTSADGYNMTDFGSDTLEKEQTEMFMARQMKFIGALERALARIENGSYGRCKETGKLISKERLRAVPHTELSIQAKRDQQPR